MPVLILLIVLVVCFVSDANKTAESVKKGKELKEQGAFLERDYNKYTMAFQDFWNEWYEGDRSSFPKEYHAYFEINKDALNCYISSLTSQREIKEGRQPILCVGLYNKHIYDAFREYNRNYNEKVDIFNNTSRMYV